MKKRTFLLAAVAMVAAACSRQAEAPQQGSAGSDPAEAVAPIYAPYMTPNGDFPRFRDQAPWSADLWSKIEAMIARSNQINEPILDFDPIINAQDGQISALAVTTDGVVENSHATVRARFANLGRQEEVLYDLIWEDNSWRVDNIRTSEWDLRQIVTQGGAPLPAESGEGM